MIPKMLKMNALYCLFAVKLSGADAYVNTGTFFKDCVYLQDYLPVFWAVNTLQNNRYSQLQKLFHNKSVHIFVYFSIFLYLCSGFGIMHILVHICA